MALNSSGPLSFGGSTVGQSINLELGVSATALASINAANFRSLAGVASGQISLSNFYGKSNVTYYFMRLTVSGASVLSDYKGHGVDSSGNFYWCGNYNSSGSEYVLKATSTGSSSSGYTWSMGLASPTFYQVTLTPSGRMAMSVQGYGNNTNPPSTLMGAAFLSAAGSPSFYGGSSVTSYYWFDSGGSQVKSDLYTDASYKPGGVDSSQNTYHLAQGYSFYISGYDPCTGDPIFDVQSSCMALMKITSSNTIAYVYQIGIVNGTQTYAYMNTTLYRTDGLLVIGAQNTGGSNNFTFRLINDSAQTTTWNYKYTVTASGWGGFNYNTPCLQAIDSSNNMYAVASTSRTTYGQGVLVMKCNSSGGVTWVIGLRRTAGSSNFSVSGLAVDSSGNVYVSGTYANTYGFVSKLNSSGILQWSIAFSGTSGSGSVIITRGVYITPTGPIAVFLTNTNNFAGNMVMTLPTDGSKTGTFTVGGQSIVIDPGSSITQDTGLTVSVANATNTAGFYAGSMSTRNSFYSGSTASLTTAVSTTTI